MQIQQPQQSNQDVQVRYLDQHDHLDEDANIINRLEEDEDKWVIDKRWKQRKQQILFEIQSLGSRHSIKRDGKTYESYIKGKNCEKSIKQLIKFIQIDGPQNPISRFILSEFNIIESDLIQLFNIQVEDRKLSFWIVTLMKFLTDKCHEDLSIYNQQVIKKSLVQYKSSFVKNQCLTILTIHIADFLKLQPQKRFKAHIQMFQFAIKLIRNLMVIKEIYGQSNIHNHFLLAFTRESIFQSILFIIQQKTLSFENIDIPLLEIFFHSFTCFKPENLYSTEKKKPIKFSKKKNSINMPTRHSRFSPRFLKTNSRGVPSIAFKIQSCPEPITGRKIPNRIVQLKKIENISRQYLPQNFLEIFTEDNKDGRMKFEKLIFDFSKQFIEVSFELLNNLVFKHIFKQSKQKVTLNNIIEYMMLCVWALRVTRCKYRKQISECQEDPKDVELELSQIAHLMQNSHFELIYKTMYRQIIKTKKKDFKVNKFHAALLFCQEYLGVLNDMAESQNVRSKKNASILMVNVLKHDIARVFKTAFNFVVQEDMTQKLIGVVHNFFKLFSGYTKGKLITITTNRQLKAKKKYVKKKKLIPDSKPEQKSSEQQIFEDDHQISPDEQIIEQYPEGYEGWIPEEEEKEDNHKKMEKKKGKILQVQNNQDQLRFQQRQCNITSEFAIIANYEIISKYLFFLKKQRFLTNNKELNQAIFQYFKNIVVLLKGEWLFYQTQTLVTFQNILSNHQFIKSQVEYKNLLDHICKGFIRTLTQNPLVLVESLFRFSSLSLKDQIIGSYNVKKPKKFEKKVVNRKIEKKEFEKKMINKDELQKLDKDAAQELKNWGTMGTAQFYEDYQRNITHQHDD